MVNFTLSSRLPKMSLHISIISFLSHIFQEILYTFCQLCELYLYLIISIQENKLMNMYPYYLEHFAGQLPIGKAFDIVERKVLIGGRCGRMYFVDGLTNTQKCQILLTQLFSISAEKMEKCETSQEFVESSFAYISASCESDVDVAVSFMYSGLTALILDGFDKIIIADTRLYPQRSVAEPEKEKTLRGPKDGFTESFMQNIALIRRRIRDNRLIFTKHTLGEKSKTDISLCYIEGSADQKLVDKIRDALDSIHLDSVSVGDQTVIEAISRKLWPNPIGRFNPYPKVRYTQRPDIVTAHLTEGKIAIIVDNTPTVLLLPVAMFDFGQDVDDYYFPLITGNYLRLLRIFNILVITFLTPLYLLFAEGYLSPPFSIDFIVPTESYALPIFWQFILLELAIDGLKLASLNTPDSLGMSLSVIGALILGEFSIDSGWFIPQTILMMAVVALASFTQPSIELSYAIKYLRLLLLLAAYFFSYYGLIAMFAIWIIVLAFTKTLGGRSYLYPLIPLDFSKLKKLLFRTIR